MLSLIRLAELLVNINHPITFPGAAFSVLTQLHVHSTLCFEPHSPNRLCRLPCEISVNVVDTFSPSKKPYRALFFLAFHDVLLTHRAPGSRYKHPYSLGPAVRFNPEYLDRRRVPAPGPGGCVVWRRFVVFLHTLFCLTVYKKYWYCLTEGV